MFLSNFWENFDVSFIPFYRNFRKNSKVYLESLRSYFVIFYVISIVIVLLYCFNDIIVFYFCIFVCMYM